jgi:hypothetical protein
MILKAGGKYRLRDGTRIVLLELRQAIFKRGAKRHTHPFWIGQIVGHEGHKLTWQADGSYSPVCESELDITGVAK